MGKMCTYQCEKCGYEIDIFEGIGFSFFELYEETINKIKVGSYGKEIQEQFNSDENTAVSCDKDVYFCSGCKEYANELTLSLYKPKGNHKEICGIVMPNECKDKKDYELLYEPPHICEICGTVKKRVNLMKIKKCPKCGSKVVMISHGWWD